MDKKAFGQRLKFAISNAGYVQADAAKLIGIALPTLSKYINGHRVPDADLVIQMAKLLGCEIKWLLTGEGPMTRGDTEGLNISDVLAAGQGAYPMAFLQDPGIALFFQWLMGYWQTASPQEWEIFKASFVRNYPGYAAWIAKKEEELQMTLVR